MKVLEKPMNVIELIRERPIDPSISLKVKKLESRFSTICDPENFQILWLENGIESVYADSRKIPSYTHTLFFLQPGRKLRLQYSNEKPTGWIIWMSQSFFLDLYLDLFNVQYADVFFNSTEIQRIVLNPKIGQRITSLADMISEINLANLPNKEIASAALLKTLFVYCDSKCNIKVHSNVNVNYMNLVGLFRHHVSRNFFQQHHVGFYADLLNVSPKHLNRAVKEITGMSAKTVILEQLMIQACHDLKFTNLSIKEVAIKLGFVEPEHFSNFFRKNAGCSPSAFKQQ